MGCSVNSCPALHPTDSTLKPQNIGPRLLLRGLPLGSTHLQGLLGSRPWELVVWEPARLSTQGLAHNTLRPSGFWGHLLQDPGPSVQPGAGRGSLCLLQGCEWGKQTSGVQPLPTPRRRPSLCRAAVFTPCHSLPARSQGTQAQAPACIPTALTLSPHLLQRGMAPQLLPKPSRI